MSEPNKIERYYSPLRYPGGKAGIEPFIELLIEDLGLVGGTYIEPFAGGAGVAIELLEKKIVSEIVINDLDKGIYSFWRAIITETDRFIDEVARVHLNIEEWEKQRAICLQEKLKYSFELGFATFYLNRTNRSGIIKGGPIGGKEQQGKWRLDARFNKATLIQRIIKIAELKNRIHLYNKDVESFMLHYLPKYDKNAFIYFDPPYIEKGKQLYMNFLNKKDHERIAETIGRTVKSDWIITYDDVPQVASIYNCYPTRKYDIRYSAAEKRTENELMIFKNESLIPDEKRIQGKKLHIRLRQE